MSPYVHRYSTGIHEPKSFRRSRAYDPVAVCNKEGYQVMRIVLIAYGHTLIAFGNRSELTNAAGQADG